MTETWMVGMAIVLAAATIAGVMTPWLLLALPSLRGERVQDRRLC
jgi:hypothetical protein